MSTIPPPRAIDTHAFDRESLAALNGLPADQLAEVRRLVEERDHLVLLHETIVAAEGAHALDARLRMFVGAVRKLGFGRAVATLRDADLNAIRVIAEGMTDAELRLLREAPASGDVWRRRLAAAERFRVSHSYYLDARDPWVQREFRTAVPSRLDSAGARSSWTPGDALLVPATAGDGRIVATLILDEPVDRQRPTLARVQVVELFAQQMAHAIEQARLVELAERRAERLQRLHEVGNILARSLDEREIIRELARQLPRVVPADGIVIAHPDHDGRLIHTALRLVRGVERPRAPVSLGRGPIAEVARTGRPVRIATYDPELVPLAAADDAVGDGGPAGSLLAVPMLIGIHLVGVLVCYTSEQAAYSLDDEEVLLTIAAQTAASISNARLYAESMQERRQTEALADVARAVGESLRAGEVTRLILRHAVALLHSEAALLMLRVGDEIAIVAATGTPQGVEGMRFPAAGSLTGRALGGGETVISNDVSLDPDVFVPAMRAANVSKIIISPLVTAQGVIGALAVINREMDFTDTDARVLHRLADHVAVALVNARLYEEVEAATREWAIAFDAVASGMVVLDPDGVIRRCNAQAARLLKRGGPQELLGLAFHEAVLGEPGPEGCVHWRAIVERTIVRATHRVPAEGRIYDILASPHPAGGAVVTFDDVTDQHALAERHRRVVETAGDAIVITDAERRIAFANPAALALFDRGDHLIGMLARETLAPEVTDEVSERERRAFDGEPQRYEAVVVRPDGERRIVSVSTSPLREVGEVTGIVASLRDVTDERRARDAVSQSEARYRNLVESASDAIYTLDRRGHFTSANEATCNVLGVTATDILARPVAPYVAADDVAAVQEHFDAALAGESRRYECRLVRGDGSQRLVSVTNTPVRKGSSVVGVLGIARDVTVERERAEALRRSEARYSQLVESASDAIFTVDCDGLFTSVNRALEQTTGQDRLALAGRPFTDVVDSRDHEATRAVFRATIAGERKRANFTYLDQHGSPRAGWIITSPIVDEGRVTGALGIVRDVTEENLRAEQLLQQEKLAAIGQLVSGVAHELNNPLAGVTAFSQLLLADGGVNAEQQEGLETIHREAKRAAKIVANLLTFARQHKPERAVTDLNQVVLDTVELRRYALRMGEVDVEVSLAPDLPSTWADPHQLQQVVLNLITNAEHALAGRPTPRQLRIGTALAGTMLTVTVADNGPGIAEEHVARIFNPFYTTKPVGQGTGLGLSISDGLIRGHSGRIRVETEPGRGAAFIVELPLVPPPPPQRATVSPAAAAPARGKVRSVLVVDDEPAVRSAVRSYLSSLGCAVETAGSGREALERLRNQRFDRIVLDLRMPDVGGDAVYSELAATDAAHAGSIVFLTGDVQSATARDFIASTGRPCVSKPFELTELARVLLAETR